MVIGKVTYYIPGQSLTPFLSPQAEGLSPQAGDLSTRVEDLSTRVKGLSTMVEGLSPQVKGLSPQAEDLSPQVDIPAQLQDKIDAIGQRITNRAVMEEVIIELCSLHSLSSKQLASIISREEKYLKKYYLKKLLKEGSIQYTIPEMISHPQQKYRANP